MKIGDTYYEKHTVVGISKRTNTVSETDVEIVNVLPIDVLDKIRAEIMQMPTISFNANDIYKADALAIIDKYKAEENER